MFLNQKAYEKPSWRQDSWVVKSSQFRWKNVLHELEKSSGRYQALLSYLVRVLGREKERRASSLSASVGSCCFFSERSESPFKTDIQMMNNSSSVENPWIVAESPDFSVGLFVFSGIWLTLCGFLGTFFSGIIALVFSRDKSVRLLVIVCLISVLKLTITSSVENAVQLCHH